MSAQKWIYFFGPERTEGSRELRELLGGKGANLAEMCNLGVPVPPGFTISTEACNYHYQHDGRFPEGYQEELRQQMGRVEATMGARFGDPENPLLVSVRSGARVSMPGMMDTVLNIGLSAKSLEGMAKYTGNPRLVADSYRRFVQMYGDVVLEMRPESPRDPDPFEVIIEQQKERYGIENDTDFSAEQLLELADLFKAAILEQTGKAFPDDPHDQLSTAIGAVFKSWGNDRAIAYREMHSIPEEWGTAVNVQAMVFGNRGETSATGVAFTRDPATGASSIYGEYLANAQGEDVVAGIRTPLPIAHLDETFPEASQQLKDICARLEKHYTDMQDVEFTIDDNRLWMLQTRTGKRTGLAAVRIAVDFVEEGLIDTTEAVRRVEPDQLDQVLRPVFADDEDGDVAVLAQGRGAGPGAATGRIVFHAADAEAWAARGEKVLLVRIETSPEDIRGMAAAEGILTARGGMTSHAALVARQMGRVCIVGCGELEIDYVKDEMTIGEKVYKEGDWLSLNGSTGDVIEGRHDTIPSDVVRALDNPSIRETSDIVRYYDALMGWADGLRRLGVRANADQPDQARTAIYFGAKGIGLCRTEHMFFASDRIHWVQDMILAADLETREEALSHLLPIQRSDFTGLLREMAGLPVTIRLLDPPLHEFLPHKIEEVKEIAKDLHVTTEWVEHRVETMTESNPMLGHRGCRLGLTHPEITRMQVRAIVEATCDLKDEGVDARPEIMVPLVGHANELASARKTVEETIAAVLAERGQSIDILIGTMIELPRAALTADKLSPHADFFSFGTNDLTQTTFGLSRDDSSSFLGEYIETGILPADPFRTIDIEGVGQLVRMGVERGRAGNPGLHVGICGEHGGDPASVEFCHQVGLDYVSCSPFRLPIARLAAAHAALNDKD